jgi:hypothetical protein
MPGKQAARFDDEKRDVPSRWIDERATSFPKMVSAGLTTTVAPLKRSAVVRS